MVRFTKEFYEAFCTLRLIKCRPVWKWNIVYVTKTRGYFINPKRRKLFYCITRFLRSSPSTLVTALQRCRSIQKWKPDLRQRRHKQSKPIRNHFCETSSRHNSFYTSLTTHAFECFQPSIPVWNSGYSMRRMEQYFPLPWTNPSQLNGHQVSSLARKYEIKRRTLLPLFTCFQVARSTTLKLK